MKTTMRAIAERLGVSEMAVSFALRGDGRLSNQTRQRIIETARKMGYRPHAASRAMSSGKFNCVALILSKRIIYSDLPPQVLLGIDNTLLEHNYHMTVCHFPDEALTDASHIPKLLREWFVDGLLINYHFGIPPAMTGMIQESGIPSIWINTKQPVSAVRPDDEQAARMLTQHLVKLGHERIAYVDYSHSGDADGEHYSAADRRRGFEQAAAEAGITPKMIFRSGRPGADRVVLSMEWLDAPDRPTAVVCYSSSHAMSVICGAYRLGLEIPTDLSVSAVDTRVTSLGPPITTALLPAHQMGVVAAQMLLAQINGAETEMPCCVLAPTLEAGGTTAPPPARRRRLS